MGRGGAKGAGGNHPKQASRNKTPSTNKKQAHNQGGNNNEDVRRETPLQAIVFADSFAETFRPITLEAPKVLLPLANVPMIEYTLEFLASSGVKEVVLFCTHHAEQLEQYIKTQSTAAQRIEVQCVTSPSCLTAGDALREVDRQQLIQSNPFIMISGDVVANVNLQEAIEEHQARKKKDPSVMMTSIFKEVPANYSTNIRPLHDELVVGIDQKTSQIVLYENDPSRRSTRLATIFLEDHDQLTLRTDLMDCFIDVCSTDVLLKFAEDFDYQDLRKDFYHNEVQNFELGKKFYVKIVNDAFAARVMDPRTYSGVTHAILQRWVFPLVPDNNYLGEATSFTYHRNMVYKEEHVVMARTCSIQRECVIGAGATFGDRTTIIKSTIGRNCRIGKNVKIENSFVWSNVTIEDNVVIKNAMLCDNVIVRSGSVIDEGCILSYGVVIGAGFHLKPFSKITTVRAIEEDDGFSSDDEASDELDFKKPATASTAHDEENEEGWDTTVVGEGGVGRLWTLDDDDIQADSDIESDEEDAEEEVDEDARRLEKLKYLMIGGADVVAKKTHKWDDWDTLSSSDEEDEDDLLLDHMLPQEVDFHQIIREMVFTGDTAGHGVDDLFMEIKSFKFAQNKSFADVIGAIVPGLLDLIPTHDSPSAMQILAHVRTKFTKWSSVLKRCLVDDDDQTAVIHALEAFCASDTHRALWSPLFRFLLQTVYDLEWVMEDIIIEWHDLRSQEEEEEATVNFAKTKDVQAFIDWLQEEDDEEDEDDEDEDDSEEESEEED